MKVIETERLILRTWKEEGAEAYFHINQDPKVIEFLLGPMAMEEVKTFIERCNRDFEEKQFCLFATELKISQTMIGFIGIWEPPWETHFTPCPSMCCIEFKNHD